MYAPSDDRSDVLEDVTVRTDIHDRRQTFDIPTIVLNWCD